MREQPKRAYLGGLGGILWVFRLVAVCRSAKQVAEHGRRRVVVLRDGVRVPVERDARAGMPQAGLDRLHVHAVGEQQRGLVTIGTVQPVDYAVTSSLAADVATLQDDVAGIDGNLSVATSTTYVQETVTEAIDDLDALRGVHF